MSPSNASFTEQTQNVWAAVKRHAKEHHDSVNAAYTTYYGITTAPRTEQIVSKPTESRRSSVDKAWHKIKKHAKEHHQSVNAAYSTYYGINTPHVQSPTTSTETSPRVSVDRV